MNFENIVMTSEAITRKPLNSRKYNGEHRGGILSQVE